MEIGVGLSGPIDDVGKFGTGYANTAAVIAGLGTNLYELWDADNAANITLVSTDHVSAWKGEKNAISLAQGSDARRPQYLPTGWNGAKPCIFFEGTVLRNLITTSFAILPTGATPFEAWLLVDVPGATGTKVPLQWPNNTAGQKVNLATFRSGVDPTDRFIVTGTGSASTNVDATVFSKLSAKHIWRGRWELARVMAGADTTCQTSLMASNPEVLNIATSGIFALGSQSSNGGFWGGSIRKLIITKLLTEEQSKNLYQYLRRNK